MGKIKKEEIIRDHPENERKSKKKKRGKEQKINIQNVKLLSDEARIEIVKTKKSKRSKSKGKAEISSNTVENFPSSKEQNDSTMEFPYEVEESQLKIEEPNKKLSKKKKKRSKQGLDESSANTKSDNSIPEEIKGNGFLDDNKQGENVLFKYKKKSKKVNDSEGGVTNTSYCNSAELSEEVHGSDDDRDSVYSEFDMDSYPSDTDEETNEKSLGKNSKRNLASESSDETTSSDEESNKSNVSEFDMDSYPSDTDDETDQKKGLPVKAAPSAELEEKEGRTIFVGNLPHSVQRNMLKKWFSKFGKVECARLRSAPIANPEIPRKVAVITKSFHESRTNIHAYIRFLTIEAAKNALQANGALFNDHVLRVDSSKHTGSYDPKKAVFIGNVPFSLEENTLSSFFSECGDIDSVRIVRDKSTGVGKGFAYVNFKCSSSVPLAFKLDGEILDKREIRVKPIKYVKKNARPAQRFFNYENKSGNKFQNHNKRGVNKFKKPNNNDQIKKTSKFQGHVSKKRLKKQPKKKSAVERKQEMMSKILTNTSKKTRNN